MGSQDSFPRSAHHREQEGPQQSQAGLEKPLQGAGLGLCWMPSLALPQFANGKRMAEGLPYKREKKKNVRLEVGKSHG